MAKESTLFHESWHRIAKQKIILRSSVQVQRQFFRGSKWFILHDPFSNNYYRLRPEPYQFIIRLTKNKSVEEVWDECMNINPDITPGQGEVIELLAQLYHANLLHSDLAPDSAKLFERYKKRKQRILQSNLMNIMFFRIPLFDPDELLNTLRPFLKLLISPIGLVLWLGVIGFGIKIAIENIGSLMVQSEGILAPSNLILLYLSLVVIKSLHEFGHSFMVKRFGGEVHTMGIMFLIFNPLPYMDATDAWSFRNKWQRVLVGSAGMIFEIFIAACALLIWAYTGPGVIHSLCYNMVLIASVSTVLFNINPLLRFDGYYILSDLLDFPNLHQQAKEHLTWLVEYYVFGCKDSETPATSGKEIFWLTFFGIFSNVYRFFVFGSILLFVADKFLLAGITMALICLISWVVVPIGKMFKYLTTSPRLYRTRTRAVNASISFAIILFALLHFTPLPYNFTAPGIIEAVDFINTINKASGRVTRVQAQSGSIVKTGDTLIVLENPQIASRIKEAKFALTEAEVMRHKALYENVSDVKSIEGRIDFYSKRLERLEKEEKELTLVAESNGYWVAPEIKDFEGKWIGRGSPLGMIVNNDRFKFVSVVKQQDASQLFTDEIISAELKMLGQSDRSLDVTDVKRIPVEQTVLPSPVLGINGGGSIATDVTDPSGIKTKEPFYEVYASVVKNKDVAIMHGRSGIIRFTLPKKSLTRQVWLRMRQLIQKRYKI